VQKEIRKIFKKFKHFEAKKILLSSRKYGFGIRKRLIPDPHSGVKIAPDPASATMALLLAGDSSQALNHN
jgi:hypothetical protein